MEEFLTATVVTALFYAALRFFKISWFKQSFPPSFIYIAGVFAWFTAFALVAAIYSFVSMVVDVTSPGGSGLFIQFVTAVIVFSVAAKYFYDKPQVLDIRHMISFLRSAILFRPYDARRQELSERDERLQFEQAMKAATERAASGQPAEVIELTDDEPFNENPAPAIKEIAPGPSEIELLAKGEVADISGLFTGSAGQHPHPLYQYVSLARINPTDRRMSLNLSLPYSATEPELNQNKLQQIKKSVYELFQAMLAEQWLKPYLTFFDVIGANCLRLRKDEFDMARETLFLTVAISVMRLRLSKGKTFDLAEFEKNATITMHE